MGCVRLYPDIIVAIEISSINDWENNPDSITVYIGDCLADQKTYASFIHNAFIGFEGKVWNKDDYKRYFQSLPQFFALTEDGFGYIVNLEALKNEKQQISYLKLLTQGTYSQKILEQFELVEKEKRLVLQK